MNVLYLASFIGGLLLAVRIMMYGVERPRGDSTGERSFRLSPPLVVALATVFGASGYILTRSGIGTVATRVLSAAVLAAVSAFIAGYLVKKWWTVTPEHDVDDERYVLQGHVARVTKSIRAGVDGEIGYEIGRERHVMRARSFDDAALAEGTEVVIERIEDGIAYVEAWVEVEKRL
jgi:membrane protein implicated in regulation of membrane protease activity